MASLQSEVERLSAVQDISNDSAARAVFQEFRDALTQGRIRAAEKRDEGWRVNIWVKQGILLGFRLGAPAQMGSSE